MATSGGGTITVTSSSGICTWSGWAGVTSAVRTLSVTAQVDVDNNGGTTINTLSYTLDGQTFTNFFSATGTLPSATYTVSIPSGTNLANVSITATSYCRVPRTDGSEIDAAMTVSAIKIL